MGMKFYRLLLFYELLVLYINTLKLILYSGNTLLYNRDVIGKNIKYISCRVLSSLMPLNLPMLRHTDGDEVH